MDNILKGYHETTRLYSRAFCDFGVPVIESDMMLASQEDLENL